MEKVDLFQNTTVDSVVGANFKLISINALDSLPKAFTILTSNNIYSAPVVNATTGEFTGFLDLLDIITFIVKIFDEVKEEVGGRNKHAPADLYELLLQVEKFDFEHAGRVAALSKRNPTHSLPSGSSVEKALEIFAKSGTHRIPIMEGTKIKSVLTQSAILYWIHKHIQQIPNSIRSKLVKDLKAAHKPVISIKFDQQALEAFRLMAENNISAVAVVDDKGLILSNLSAKDVKILEPDAFFTKMYKTVLELIQLVRSKDYNEPNPSFCVQQHCTLGEVLAKFAVLKVHRLYVEDEHKRPLGVLSLGDVLTAFV